MSANVLLVAGSRDLWKPVRVSLTELKPWYDVPALVKRANHIMDNLSYVHGVTFDLIIHGDARGVDRVGAQWARLKDYKVRAYPADWEKHGKQAGFIRNSDMVRVATHAVVLWDGFSPGTEHTLRLLRNFQKPVALYQANHLVKRTVYE